MRTFFLKYPISTCLLLSLVTYGLSSFIYINYLEIGHSRYGDFTFQLLQFQLATILLSFLLEFLWKKKIVDKTINTAQVNNSVVFFFFVLCSIIFYFFPWSEDRESKMAQVAAIFRGLWFIIIVIKMTGANRDLFYLLLSMILMVIDTSRSTFAALCIIHLFRRKSVSVNLGILIIALVLGVASFRSLTFEFSNLFNSLFVYGFFGEGVNGSLGTFQLLSTQNSFVDDLLTVIVIFLQPFLTPFKVIFNSVLPFFDSSYFHSKIVMSSNNEEYYPMGGFYIVSEFIRLNFFGSLLLLLYIKFSCWLTKLFFPFKDSAVQFTLIFLMLKMSPYTYWKWTYYITFIHFIIIMFPIYIRNQFIRKIV